MATKTEKPEKPTPRKGTRFPAELNTVANLTMKFAEADQASENKETFVALVKNESMTGCCLVLVTGRKIENGSEGICKIGRLGYCKVQVRWVKKVSPRVLEVGLHYIT